MEAPLPLPPAPRRPTSPWPWLFLGCGIFVLMAFVAAGAGAYFLVRRATGTEVAWAPVVAGQDSSLSFVVGEPVPHALWLRYDVAFVGGDFLLEGPLTVRAGTSTLVQDTLSLGPSGPVTAGGFGRLVVDARRSSINGRGADSARVKLVDLPALPVGTAVTATLAASPRSGTQINALQLVVTR